MPEKGRTFRDCGKGAASNGFCLARCPHPRLKRKCHEARVEDTSLGGTSAIICVCLLEDWEPLWPVEEARRMRPGLPKTV